MNTLRIHNWSKWQDDPTDGWFKVYCELVRKPEWLKLTDAQRGQLVTVWMLAAENGGRVPDNNAVVKRMGGMSETLKLDLFITLGFIDRPDRLVRASARTNRGPSKSYAREFEHAWFAYRHKGSKSMAYRRWNEVLDVIQKRPEPPHSALCLVDRVKLWAEIHQNQPLTYWKDFERWLSTGKYDFDERAERELARSRHTDNRVDPGPAEPAPRKVTRL